MKFRVFIPYAMNENLLKKSVISVANSLKNYSSYEIPIVVINNTLKKLPQDFPYLNLINEVIPCVDLLPAQNCNLLIKMSQESEDDFAVIIHADAELKEGAMTDILDKYTEVAGTQWVYIHTAGIGEPFCAINWRFFAQEHLSFDAFLFPFYYSDNHMDQIRKSRGGWINHNTVARSELLVNHVSSHAIKEDSTLQRKNAIAFPIQGQMYQQIWGGLPGSETKLDPTAGGTLKYPF